MNKKPYLDLWGYVASIAPEQVAEEGCFDQTWISTERIPEESMVLIPNQFIRYFRGQEEIQAKYNNGLMRFTRVDPYRKQKVVDSLRKIDIQDKDIPNITHAVDRTEEVIIIRRDFNLSAHLTQNQADLELIAEELKQIGGVVSIDGMWRDDLQWEEVRCSGMYCPAPYNIPIVVDFKNEQLVLSPELHLKAEKLMLKRAKDQVQNKEKRIKISEWGTLVTGLRAAHGKTFNLEQDRKFYLSLVRSNPKTAKILSDMKAIGISIDKIIDHTYSDGMDKLLAAQVNLHFDHVKKQLTATKAWRSWEKEVIIATAKVRLKWSECSNLRKSIRRAMAAEILQTFRMMSDKTWLHLSKKFKTRAWDEYAWVIKTFNAELKWPTANAVTTKTAR